MASLPRVIYHSCDRLAMEKIVEHGLIPGGWPQRTGRAHNFFIASHPWDDSVGGKKLAGTRAGKQYYIAFDTELVVQSGCRLFSGRMRPSLVLIGSPTRTSFARMTR